MVASTARIPTAHAEKYLKQLCKHWSHNLDVELAETTGTVHFSHAVANMAAGEDSLTVTIEAEEDDVLQRMKGVVASHLDRFAFREAPLTFNWS